jgi:hypothetical protein
MVLDINVIFTGVTGGQDGYVAINFFQWMGMTQDIIFEPDMQT